MKKIKITDKFLSKCRKVLSDLSVFFVFTMGIGLGFIFAAGADPNDAIEIAAPLVGSALYFVALLLFLYMVVTVERIFLYLKGKENEKSEIDN